MEYLKKYVACMIYVTTTRVYIEHFHFMLQWLKQKKNVLDFVALS